MMAMAISYEITDRYKTWTPQSGPLSGPLFGPLLNPIWTPPGPVSRPHLPSGRVSGKPE